MGTVLNLPCRTKYANSGLCEQPLSISQLLSVDCCWVHNKEEHMINSNWQAKDLVQQV